jgi:hypothetical protein
MAKRETSLDEVYRWFRAYTEKFFAFLVSEYGCRRQTRDDGPDGIFTRFQNETTGVEVGYEPMDDARGCNCRGKGLRAQPGRAARPSEGDQPSGLEPVADAWFSENVPGSGGVWLQLVT